MRKLRIEELFIGAWVQERIAVANRLAPPMYVSGVFEGGDMYLDIEGNEGDPLDANVQDIFGLPINEKVLRSFGFVPTKGDNVWLMKVRDFRLTVALKWQNGEQIARRVAISGRTNCWNEELRCIHELQRWWVDKVLLPFSVPLLLSYQKREVDNE